MMLGLKTCWLLVGNGESNGQAIGKNDIENKGS